MSNPNSSPLEEAAGLNAKAEAKKAPDPNKMDPQDMDQQQLALLVAMGEMAKKMTTHGVMMIAIEPVPGTITGELRMAAEFMSVPELMEAGVDRGWLARIVTMDPTVYCWFMMEGQFIERQREDLIQEAADYTSVLKKKHKEFQEKKAEASRN